MRVIHGLAYSHAHAVQYERRRALLSRVIVLPTGFGECLMSLANPHASFQEDRHLASVQRRIAMYPGDEIWNATLLLAPIQIQHHWILIAVSNPFKAVSRESKLPEAHDLLPGELKPDREPFTMLVFNSAPLYAPKTIQNILILMRRFLEFSWSKLKSSPLEFVNWSAVRVSSCSNPQNNMCQYD